MTLASSDEREDLEALVASPGWRLFVVYMMHDFDERFCTGVESIAAKDPTDATAMVRVRAFVAQREDRRMLKAWPEDRIKTLKRGEQHRTTDTHRRRGRA